MRKSLISKKNQIQSVKVGLTLFRRFHIWYVAVVAVVYSCDSGTKKTSAPK